MAAEGRLGFPSLLLMNHATTNIHEQVLAVIVGFCFSRMNPRSGHAVHRVSVFTKTATLSPRGTVPVWTSSHGGHLQLPCTLLVLLKGLFFNLATLRCE